MSAACTLPHSGTYSHPCRYDACASSVLSVFNLSARILHDEEYPASAGIGGKTVMTCFIVRACPVNGTVVLGHMEIDRPRAQGGERPELLHPGGLIVPLKICREYAVFRRL